MVTDNSLIQAHTKSNQTALLYMGAKELLASTLPLALAIGSSNKSPFFFVTIIYVFGNLTNIIHLIGRYYEKINYKTFKIILDRWQNPTIYWIAIARFDYVLFAFALKYIDVAIATILIGAGPIFITLITSGLFKKERRFQRITPKKWLLYIIGFAGCGLVIASQSNNMNDAVNGIFALTAIAGIILAIISALLGSVTPASAMKWGVIIAQEIQTQQSGPKTTKDNELFFSIIATIIGRFISIILFLLLGLLAGESFSDIEPNGYASAGLYGIFGTGVACVFLRLALLTTDNLGITAVSYAKPGIALIWLSLASLITIPHIDWLIVGAITIMAVIFLINLDAIKNHSIQPAQSL